MVRRLSIGLVLALIALAALLGADLPRSHGSGSGDCASCHSDPHAGTAREACTSCHTTAGWTPSTFGPDRHELVDFVLSGRHREVACGACHAGGKLTGLPGACAECHVDRHRGKLGNDCESCHTTDGFAPVPGFDHEKTGFVLHGRHEKLECKTCHDGENERAMLYAKEPAACATCHEAAHGDFRRSCTPCHSDQDASFAAAAGTLDARGFDHRETGFPIERRHEVVACAGCHPAAGPTPIARCSACHLDPHAGQLTNECQDCHRADRWRLARFDHDMTGWVLRGRHFVTPCADCHTSQRWIGAPTECWDCHALDAAAAPKNVSTHAFGRTDCGDCHSTWTFRR